jgi:hypothetical protein
MKKLLDADDPFFAPVWRRWATCVLPLLWAAFEVYSEEWLWAGLFAAAGAYAWYVLIFTGPSDR